MNLKNVKIILASASPRRRELIAMISQNVDICPADCDETLPCGIGAREAVEYLSKIKNQASAVNAPAHSLVISADTVVAVDNQILGKPVDRADAREMMLLLSGRVHQVYTGVTLSLNGKYHTFSEKTDVEFYPLSEKELEEYLTLDTLYDKAGAYAIQGEAGVFTKGINGDYYNVVGLPVARLKREAERFLNEL